MQIGPLGSGPAAEAPHVPPKLQAAIDTLNRGDAEAALKTAREFVKEDPRSALGHEILGAAAIARSQWAEAERALNEALKLEPRRASALIRLGQLALETKDPKKAEGYFKQALAIAPGTSAARHNLAIAQLRQGQVQNAIATAQESLRLTEGKDLDAKYLLAGI